ncbi:MAG: YdeI/OmpD-associated family protein [Myxococcota bacterium]
MSDDREQVCINSADELRAWLMANHERRDSVWLVTWKKSSPAPYVPRREVLKALLAYGWIDSVPRKLDASRTMLLISPRKRGSSWSKVNKEIIDELVAAGAMAPPGAQAVEAAKRDGSWERLEAVDALMIPADLRAALDSTPNASGFFAAFPPSSVRGILEWIQNAKRPETRAKRIAETARKASVNLKANHPKGRDRGPTKG